LGPLLFIIFMDDLPNITEEPLFLFADDTVILSSDKNIDRLIDNVTTDFRRVCTFFRKHKLSLNPDKTNCIIFTNFQIVHETKTHVFIDNNNEGENLLEHIHEIKQINLTASSCI